MKKITVAAKKRSAGDNKKLRNEGYIPCVIYGPGIDEESILVAVEYQEFRKAFRIAGESTVIELDVEGTVIPTIVHIPDFHPVTDNFEHLDFFAVDMKKEVHTHISLVFEGVAPAIKEKNAILVYSKKEISVKCLPTDLVHDIKVDISGLEEYHDHISIKDLNVPSAITVLDNEDDIVVTATPPKKDRTEEEEAAEGEAGAEGAEGGEGEKKKSEEKEEKKEEN